MVEAPIRSATRFRRQWSLMVNLVFGSGAGVASWRGFRVDAQLFHSRRGAEPGTVRVGDDMAAGLRLRTCATVQALSETLRRCGRSRRLCAGGYWRRRVNFDVAADAYDRFMGRYSRAARRRSWRTSRASAAGPAGARRRLRPRRADGGARRARSAPSPSRPSTRRSRSSPRPASPQPGRRRAAGAAQRSCRSPDGTFDAALAQLVVHFMTDPVAGLTEMARVTRPDGVVAACVWDHGGGPGPAARVLARRRASSTPASTTSRSLRAPARATSPSCSRRRACARSRRRCSSVDVEHATFEEWWEPFTRGVGPAGRLRRRRSTRNGGTSCASAAVPKLPVEPFKLTAVAWAARGLA